MIVKIIIFTPTYNHHSMIVAKIFSHYKMCHYLLTNRHNKVYYFKRVRNYYFKVSSSHIFFAFKNTRSRKLCVECESEMYTQKFSFWNFDGGFSSHINFFYFSSEIRYKFKANALARRWF